LLPRGVFCQGLRGAMADVAELGMLVEGAGHPFAAARQATTSAAIASVTASIHTPALLIVTALPLRSGVLCDS